MCGTGRDPGGRRLHGWVWGVVDGRVWLLPARLGPGAALPGVRLALPAPLAGAQAFWLAVALRQHLWRAWADVRGFQPVVGVGAEAWVGGIALGAAPAPPEFALAPMLAWARARVRS